MSVSNGEIIAALQISLRRRITRLRRRPWDYSSSAPIEQLTVDGCPPMLFKNLAERSRSAPEFVVDPLREIEAYERYLVGLDAPACIGWRTTRERAWLFLERLDGVPLWQAEGAEPWLAAARYLARLHRVSPPSPPGRLLICDRLHLHRWVTRALQRTPAGMLAGLQGAAGEAIELLCAWPRSLLHGEFYPSNVIVAVDDAGPRIRPVDWEMAGIGPGLLDLAALIAGDHQPGLARRLVNAYKGQLARVPDHFDATLAAARMLVALQWIGWDPSWTPPPEHAHDWIGDALVFARAGTDVAR
jgi:hypothetical protein